MKKTIIIGAVCALLGGVSVAGAQTTDIFGWGGTTYTFDAKCHRVTFVPPGIATKEAVNVLGQQTYCLVRRPDPFAQCVRKLGPAPSVTRWHKDDWKGVGNLQKREQAIYECSKAHL